MYRRPVCSVCLLYFCHNFCANILVVPLSFTYNVCNSFCVIFLILLCCHWRNKHRLSDWQQNWLLLNCIKCASRVCLLKIYMWGTLHNRICDHTGIIFSPHGAHVVPMLSFINSASKCIQSVHISSQATLYRHKTIYVMTSTILHISVFCRTL